MTDMSKLEPWQWPDEHWRGLVNHVRAGRSLKPKSWPGGARCAVAFSFDSDHETNELRDGGKSIGRMAWGQYGARVGVPRLLALLKKHDVKATFYVPAVAAMLHPDEQKRVIAEGHEIGIHGWIHELNSVLPYDAERDLTFRAADVLEQITGVRPVGMRTPSWDFSPNTLRIEKELGLLYDSSLMADEDCYELVLEGEHRRVSGGMDSRRRALFHDEPAWRAAALHRAIRCVQHLQARTRRGVGGWRRLPAHLPSACHHAALARLDHRGSDPPREEQGQRLVCDARRSGEVREGECGVASRRARCVSRRP